MRVEIISYPKCPELVGWRGVLVELNGSQCDPVTVYNPAVIEFESLDGWYDEIAKKYASVEGVCVQEGLCFVFDPENSINRSDIELREIV